ncbi:hypothetical protein Mapa_002030 [Marchantia paleacea]|nr:hypothetical protein Mapa_002030 [Marchantia paleacea]
MYTVQRDEIHRTLSGEDGELSDGKQDDEVEQSIACEGDETEHPAKEAADSKKLESRGNCGTDAIQSYTTEQGPQNSREDGHNTKHDVGVVNVVNCFPDLGTEIGVRTDDKVVCNVTQHVNNVDFLQQQLL